MHQGNICFTMTMQGNASGGKQAQHTGKIAKSFIDSAWAFIQRQSVLPEHPPSGSYTN
jgi:acyl-CoA dehydrogenase